jgi:uncharacterized protein
VTAARVRENDISAESLKPSYYNHYTDTADPDKYVIFNKFWGSISVVATPVALAVRGGDMAAIPDDERSELEASGFLVDADLDEVNVAHERYMGSKRDNALLSITVELTQACNLSCTYCYQNSYRKPGAIGEDITGKLSAYVRSVVEGGKRPITDLVLRFIGGEPLMQKKKVLRVIFEMRELAASLNLNLHAQIDTNGLLLDESVIRELDVISVTLTNRADHDKVRVRHNGAGSYDLIVKRLTKHAEHFNEYKTLLSVRFNANAFNAQYVPDVYGMVKRLGINEVEFELYNTVNYDYNVLVPTLSKHQYKKLYLDLIKLKFEHGEVIKDFPRPTFATCAAYTPYNLKVTAEGSLALCDAFHSPVGSIDQLTGADGSLDAYREIFSGYVEHDPFQDPQCGGCTNVGICGGKYFCKSNPHADIDPCDFLQFDLDEFLRFFADAYALAPGRFRLDPK